MIMALLALYFEPNICRKHEGRCVTKNNNKIIKPLFGGGQRDPKGFHNAKCSAIAHNMPFYAYLILFLSKTFLANPW